MRVGGNGNWIDWNGREWECWKPFLHISSGELSPSVWPHNPATGFWPPSATLVFTEPFSRGTGTLQCLQKEIATYRRHWSVSLWRDPDDVPHCRILSPDKTEWRLISATLCGWRCCFVADQLWFMTRIWEEDWGWTTTTAFRRAAASNSWTSCNWHSAVQKLNNFGRMTYCAAAWKLL